MITRARKFGDEGEEVTAEYLRKRGCEILARNFLVRGGEVDLIVREGEELAFVEVKTRRNKAFGTGEEAVSQSKLEKVVQAAEEYLAREGYAEDVLWRVDVAVVEEEGGKLKVAEYFENVALE